jgi:hypothetical protein
MMGQHEKRSFRGALAGQNVCARCLRDRELGSAKHDEGLTPGTEDVDPANVTLRAGYIAGLAFRRDCDAADREMLLRASRSLLAFAHELAKPKAGR